MSRVRNILLWYTTFDIFASRSFTFNVALWIYRRHTYYPAVTVIISFSRLIGIPGSDWYEEDWHKRDASLQAVSFSSIFGTWEAESRIIQFYFNPILFNSNITHRLRWFLQWFVTHNSVRDIEHIVKRKKLKIVYWQEKEKEKENEEWILLKLCG